MDNDPFPSSSFDPWAETYDQDVRVQDQFPFNGYQHVLDAVIAQADVKRGASVLDLGAGTGNLALMFDALGCDVWCTDFARLMIEKAKIKLPRAKFFLHDLREPLPAELSRCFDAIVSAYVFHHFELDYKVRVCRDLIDHHLNSSGKLIIADLSFPTFADKERFKLNISDWEEEFFWFADESLAAFKSAGMKVEYVQVSPCAGVYTIDAIP